MSSLQLPAAVATCLAAALLSWPGPAPAEVSQEQGVRVRVSAEMNPTALPRTGAAPISVSFAGRISSLGAAPPPQLRSISVALNSHGRLLTRGLARCRLGHISPATSAEALAACRDSLIGEGRFSANVKIPEQSPFPSEGKILAFNGRLRGRPVVFAHIYGTDPVPTSYVLPFAISRSRGTYGTALSASLPQVTGDWGYVTGISMTLGRSFGSRGQGHSYLTAACPAPRGFPGVAFPLARTRFDFVGGLELATVLNRNCKVKG